MGGAPQAPPPPSPGPATQASASQAPTSAPVQASANQAPAAKQSADPVPGGAAVVPVPPPPAAEAAASGQSFGLSGMLEPKKVKTVIVRPDGTIVSDNTQPAEPAISPPITPAQNTASGTTAPAGTDMPSGTAAPSGTDDTGAIPPAAAPKVEAAKPTQVAQAKPRRIAEADAEANDTARAADQTPGFSVQLAAPASEAAALKSIAKLQRQFGGELAGRRLKYHRATVGNKSVYRVRVVGLSHAEATALCQKLQAKGGACFVAKD